MPFLVLEDPPPTKIVSLDNGSKKRTEENVIATTTTTESVEESKPPAQEIDSVEDDLGIKYPIVKLDSDKISDSTAGRLATSLLGHVLFLKNQVPFPVMQLGRIPSGKTNTRAAKQRAELLASYDTISSHLDTTFSALSTALARCSGHKSELAQVHLAILVGPSVTTAKSKLILGIDGLETRIWGSRIPESRQQEACDDETSDDENEGDHASNASGESEETPGDSEDETDGSDDSCEGPEDSDEDDEEEDVENDTDEDDGGDISPNRAPSPPPSPPYISHAEEQKLLQKADRLLSRTLAAADADGKGISSELSPTQTHVLIRAPRRFNHPAWVPRQNVTLSLDAALQDFQTNSGLRDATLEEMTARPKHSKKNPVEGVWITTRQGLHHLPSSQDPSPGVALPDKQRSEDDEMIWWSWDGKFQGFSDW